MDYRAAVWMVSAVAEVNAFTTNVLTLDAFGVWATADAGRPCLQANGFCCHPIYALLEHLHQNLQKRD